MIFTMRSLDSIVVMDSGLLASLGPGMTETYISISSATSRLGAECVIAPEER